MIYIPEKRLYNKKIMEQWQSQFKGELSRKDGKLSLSFKVGENKLFVIKKLDVFCENVKTSATDVYGSNTQINHDLNNFTDKGKSWIHFINQIVREEKEFQNRLLQSRSYYGNVKESVGGSLNLFGWRLDEFYQNLGKDTIDFEDKDSSEKKKKTISCKQCNPKVIMDISENALPGSREFHGIKVEGNLPDLYYGTDAAYFITENHLNRVEEEFLRKVEPLADLASGDHFSFSVGRNRMSEFYNRLLPQLEEIAEIRETHPSKFRSFILPLPHFFFFLDAGEKDVFCRISARYGQKEVSVFDLLRRERYKNLEPFRDETKEQEILNQAMNLKDKELLKGKLKLPMYRTLYLDKLLEENESVYNHRDSRFREVVKEFKTVKDADFEEPASLSKVMRKYQKDGYKWLRTLENWQFGGILADDMGLGKTLQVIAVLLAAKEEGKQGSSLVVTPASLVFNWGAELEKFAPELKVSLITGTQEERQKKIDTCREADVVVTSYDLLKRDISLYEDKEFNYEIIDEAQYIKNYTTASAKAVKVIHSRIRFALTGTPIENRLSELWSIFDFLMPGFLYTYEVFKREIETPIVKNDDENAMKRLQKMVSPFILRRLKEDVLKDLPEKLEEYRYVRLGGEQQKVYDAQVLHMKEQISGQNKEEFNKNKLQVLAELTRLRQICCDPSLCFENYNGERAKLEACLDLISSAIDGRHRILVFSQFTSMLEILQNKLIESGISFFLITGSTSKEKRLELVRRFNEGEVPVFLISLKAGGVGLNLTGADVVIHYDPWWNLAAQNQATDRAHRIGQTRKVTVYKLIARHTIEEKIQKLQETKKNLADQVMSGEGANLGSMSQEEILELLEV